jgi:hypothetical protein
MVEQGLKDRQGASVMAFQLKPFNRNVPDEKLLEDLINAHSKLSETGKALTFRRYGNVGKYAPSTINDRFGSWNEALRRAGLCPCQEKGRSS